MQISAPVRVLQHLFRRAGAGQPPTRESLRRELGIEPRTLESILGELEARGLVDASGLRLTLPGLALAVAARPRLPLLETELRRPRSTSDLVPVPDTRERSVRVARCTSRSA